MRLSWAKWLLLGILVLPIAEIIVFVAVAAQIGFVDAALIQLVCSLVGVAVVRSAGRVGLDRLRSQFSQGMIRTAQFDGADLVRAAAGVLLVVPGFLTDALGALLLVPALRRGLGAIGLRAAAGAPRDRVIDLEPSEWQRQESRIRQQVSDVRHHGSGVERQGSGRKPDAS
jgi:UPF0716 protein FxsA